MRELVLESPQDKSISAGAAKVMGIVCMLRWMSSAAAAYCGSRSEQGSNSPFAFQTASSEARQTEIRGLKQGQVIERELAGGEAHTYRITLTSGQYLKVVVEQKGIDVVVRLIGPTGEMITEVDGPNGPEGQEPVSAIAETSGEYRIEIRSLDKEAALGRYEIKLEAWREATPQDIEKLNEALLLWRVLGDREAEADTLDDIGLAYYDSAEPKALEYHHQTLQIWRSLGDHLDSVAVTLNNIGNAYQGVGETQKALEHYEEALKLIQNPESHFIKFTKVVVLNNASTAYMRLGEQKKPLDYLRQSLDICRALGDRRQESIILHILGLAYSNSGEFQKALEYYNQALKIKRAALCWRSLG